MTSTNTTLDKNDNDDDDDNKTATLSSLRKEFHVAPMMGVTFREFRYFVRLLTKHAVLWTEMIVDDTILHTDHLDYHLGYDQAVEPPIICQIGGNQANQAATVTRIVTHDYGYAEINLNAGCPSHRVATKRAFGAALMQDVDKAVDMLREMQKGADEETNDETSDTARRCVSIKLRIGVDNFDDWEWTHQLVSRLSTVCQRFYIHARKVHTAGLDAAQNRRIPPLHYPRVYALCRAFPHCEFWINGGIATIHQARDICYGISSSCAGSTPSTADTEPENGSQDDIYKDLVPAGHGPLPCATCRDAYGSCLTPPTVAPPNLRGCLVGRAVMDNPMHFATLDTDFFGATHNPSRNRRQILQDYAAYLIELYPRRCGDCASQFDVVTTRPPGVAPLKYYACNLCGQGTEPRPASATATAAATLVEVPQLLHRHIVGRALKPVQGAFCGIGGVAKPWRRLLQEAMNDAVRRNCGPGFLLQRALQRLEEGGDEGSSERVTAILDQRFSGGCKDDDDDENYYTSRQ